MWGLFVWYDANADANALHFPDGSFWKMTVQSASAEQDSGTLYPSQIEDSNGNLISLTYGPAVGYPSQDTNTSSRITYITDARGFANGSLSTYTLSWWSASGIPHLQSITNSVGTSESYSFSTASQTLLDPFNSANCGSATILQWVKVIGLNIEHQFQYDPSAEMTQLTTPLGGVLAWTYRTNNYSARSYREVSNRYMTALPGGPTYTWDVDQDGYPNGSKSSNPNWHTSATVVDHGANTQKAYTFSGNSDYTAGLVTLYQEIGTTGAVLLQKSYGWALGTYSLYLGSVTTTLNPGQSYAASTTTTQQVDAYGNLTRQQVTDYSGSTTGTRTYNMTYTASNSNYTPYYVFNRLVTATVTPSGGSPLTLTSITYDTGNCGGWGLTATSATNNHDPAYGTSFYFRGSPWSVSGLGNTDTVCTAYDSAGVPYHSANAAGQWVSLTTNSTTNYSLPTQIQPNGNSGMTTTASYASSWSPTSLMGPNGDQATTTYDSYGRPSQSTIPDGAVTTYTYTYYNFATGTGTNTQTATLDGRWQTTTLDGFGRTIQVQKGNGSTVVSTVQTQYAPCACSPLGKVSQVSQPYAPNATIYWTTYTYDGSGRTLTVTAPDGASTTTYSYQGNSTTVTDPAGKWKTSTVDAYGNVFVVTEPNPAGGTFTTNYTYTPANQLTGVSMTRGKITQTRTFLYSGSDLTSATNPENAPSPTPTTAPTTSSAAPTPWRGRRSTYTIPTGVSARYNTTHTWEAAKTYPSA
jgi:YD repeat-containing protein